MFRTLRLLLLLVCASLAGACGEKSASWGGPETDSVAPSRPTGLVGTAMGSSGASLFWTASTDNVAVASYAVSRNGALIANSGTTSYVDTGLAPATTYSYSVAAVDGAGNLSPNSASVNVTTATTQPPDTIAPTQPAGFTAVAASSTLVNLSWSASTDNVGVTGYTVTRNGVQIATPTATTFADSGRTPATSYTYTVTARDAAGNNSTAASASVTTPAAPPVDTTAPTQPAGFAAVAASSTLVNLSWSASTDNVGVTGYILTRNGVTIATPTATTFADSGRTPSTSYTYTVVARDAAGNNSTAASASVTTPAASTPPDTTAPTQPAGFTAVAANAILVNLSWSASTDNVGVTGYILTRNGVQIATPTTTTFADNARTPATSYTYTVVARDAAGNRSSAASASVTTPTAVTMTVDLSWDAVTAPNLNGYRVYYGTASRDYFQPFGLGLSTGNVTTLPVSGLVSGIRYFFTVTATDSLGNESGFSNEVFTDIP